MIQKNFSHNLSVSPTLISVQFRARRQHASLLTLHRTHMAKQPRILKWTQPIRRPANVYHIVTATSGR